MSSAVSDLVILVADKNMEQMIKGLLTRPQALGIRRLTAVTFVHPERDPGCLLRGRLFLAQSVHQYCHALVMFDLEGCGREDISREELQAMVTERLAQSGWGERGKAIVIDPELEQWVWVRTRAVEECLGWRSGRPDLRRWLKEQNLWVEGASKPKAPKSVMQRVLRELRRPRSSAIYWELGWRVSLAKCEDPAFAEFRTALMGWFPSRP